MIIYKITNNVNGKIYIGMTTQSISVRFAQHISLSKNSDINTIISKAIRKYGRDNFTISEIDNAENIDDLKKKEAEHIIDCKTIAPNGYNIKKGGQVGGNGGANLGKTWSKEAKKRHSKTMIDRNIIPWNKDTKGVSCKNKTSFTTQSTSGEKNPFYGKTHSKESMDKISEANKKRYSTTESRIKHSIACGGKWFEVYKIVKSTGAKRNFKIIKNEYIGSWISQAECSKDLDIRRSSISLCLNNKIRYSNNYVFRYKKEI